MMMNSFIFVCFSHAESVDDNRRIYDVDEMLLLHAIFFALYAEAVNSTLNDD